MQWPAPQSRTYIISRAPLSTDSTFELITCRVDWVVVLCHGLKLSARCASFEESQEVQARSASTCVLPRVTQIELQSDLKMATTCAGLGNV